MITTRLKIIFALTVLVNALHGIEEYLTGLYNGPTWLTVIGPLANMPANQATFAVYEIMFSLLLFAVLVAVVANDKWQFRLLPMISIFYLVELEHPVIAAYQRSYHPGLFTALLFPVLAFLFWQEWLRVYRETRQKS